MNQGYKDSFKESLSVRQSQSNSARLIDVASVVTNWPGAIHYVCFTKPWSYDVTYTFALTCSSH